MRKMLALLLAIVMVCSLAGCNKPTPTPAPSQTEQPSTKEDATKTDPAPSSEPEPTQEPTPQIQKGGNLNWVYYNKPKTLDPSKDTGFWNYAWTTLAYESPLCRDTEGNIRPQVCDFELSDDQLTLKLWVRDGVTFHDGSAVEIDDVIASIQRTVHKSPRQYVKPFIKDIQVDKGVATITFTEYNEKTLYYITCNNPFLAVMPKEIAEKYSEESGEFIKTVADAIGTGPYKFTDFVEGVSVSLERYEGYVPVKEGYTGFAAPKNAYLDSITVYANTDPSTSTLALLDGQYDLFSDVPSDFDAQLQAKGIKSLDKPGSSGAVFYFNTFGKGLAAKNADMRKAIMAAIDVPEFVSYMTDGKITTGGFCPATDEAYQTDVFSTADYMGEDNIELAKKYLAAAGYNGEEVQLAFSSAYDNVATLLANYLKAAGINYKVTMMESGTVSEFYGDPNNAWDIYYTNPSMNSTPTLLSATLMETNYNSPEKDALWKELQSLTVGSKEYMDKWKELSEKMVDDCAVIFLHMNPIVWSFHPDLHIEYEGSSPYWFNSYWDNPSEHGKK